MLIQQKLKHDLAIEYYMVFDAKCEKVIIFNKSNLFYAIN